MAPTPAAPGGLRSRFKVLKTIGKGSFGAVSEVQRINDGQLYALKEVDVKSMGQAERQSCVEEIRVLASCQHPNILAYNEAMIEGNKLCIIMEYAQEGDIRRIIQKAQQAKRPPPEDLVWKILIQVVQGLEALHSLKVLHRDIKPGNIMLLSSDPPIVKIGDLGVAKVLKNSPLTNTQVGTPYYMAPEIWRNRPYTYGCDVFSLGCLLYELATTRLPFEARSLGELSKKITMGSYPPLPSSMSRELSSLINSCLNVEPSRRPTMSQIMNSPAVQSRLHLVPLDVLARPDSSHGSVLNTIRVPRGGNLAAIQCALPPAHYATEEEREREEAQAQQRQEQQRQEQRREREAARPSTGGGGVAKPAAVGGGPRPVSRPGPAPSVAGPGGRAPWTGAAAGAKAVGGAAARPPPTPSGAGAPPPAGAKLPSRPSSAQQQPQPRGPSPFQYMPGRPSSAANPGISPGLAPPALQHMRPGLGPVPAQPRVSRPPTGAGGGPGQPQSAYNRNAGGMQPANGLNGINGMGMGVGLSAVKQQQMARERAAGRPITPAGQYKR